MEWWQPGLHQLSARDGWTQGTYRREFVFLLFHFVNSALFSVAHFPPQSARYHDRYSFPRLNDPRQRIGIPSPENATLEIPTYMQGRIIPLFEPWDNSPRIFCISYHSNRSSWIPRHLPARSFWLEGNTFLGTLILLIGCAGTARITSPFETFSSRVVTGRSTPFCTLQGKRHLHAPILSSFGIGNERNGGQKERLKLISMAKYVRRFYATFMLNYFSFPFNNLIRIVLKKFFICLFFHQK